MVRAINSAPNFNTNKKVDTKANVPSFKGVFTIIKAANEAGDIARFTKKEKEKILYGFNTLFEGDLKGSSMPVLFSKSAKKFVLSIPDDMFSTPLKELGFVEHAMNIAERYLAPTKKIFDYEYSSLKKIDPKVLAKKKNLLDVDKIKLITAEEAAKIVEEASKRMSRDNPYYGCTVAPLRG